MWRNKSRNQSWGTVNNFTTAIGIVLIFLRLFNVVLKTTYFNVVLKIQIILFIKLNYIRNFYSD